MPIYEYVCQGCSENFETLVLGKEKVCCPKCSGEKLERQMSTFSHKDSDGVYTSSGSSSCSGCAASSCATCH